MAESVTSTSLTRTLMALQWRLYLRSFRKNWGAIVGLCILAIYGVVILVAITLAVARQLVSSPGGDDFPLIARVLGVLVLLGWSVIPAFSSGPSFGLSPARFATFGMRTRALLAPIVATSLVSIPMLWTLLTALMMMVASAVWLIQSMPSQGLALVGLIALVPSFAAWLLLCAIVPRAVLAWRAGLRIERRHRELIRALGLLALTMSGFAVAVVSSGAGGIMDALAIVARSVFDVLMWTPFGAPLSIPFDLAQGFLGAALYRLALTAVSIVLVGIWWERSFDRGRLDALRGGASGTKKEKVKALVPSFMPSNALGAVTGKSLRYWRRDSRYGVSAAMVPLMGVFLITISVLSDSSGPGYVAIAVTAWTGGILISNEIGFDGPSSWVNITAGIDNRANLAGRYVALALLVVPWMLLLAIAVPLFFGSASMIALTIPASLGFLLSSWGVSLVLTGFIPYPAPAPGSFSSSMGSNAWISMLGAFFGTWIPMIPAIILIIAGVRYGHGLHVVGALYALGVGILGFWWGLRVASRRLDSHYPEAFDKVRDFVAATR